MFPEKEKKNWIILCFCHVFFSPRVYLIILIKIRAYLSFIHRMNMLADCLTARVFLIELYINWHENSIMSCCQQHAIMQRILHCFQIENDARSKVIFHAEIKKLIAFGRSFAVKLKILMLANGPHFSLHLISTYVNVAITRWTW